MDRKGRLSSPRGERHVACRISWIKSSRNDRERTSQQVQLAQLVEHRPFKAKAWFKSSLQTQRRSRCHMETAQASAVARSNRGCPRLARSRAIDRIPHVRAKPPAWLARSAVGRRSSCVTRRVECPTLKTAAVSADYGAPQGGCGGRVGKVRRKRANNPTQVLMVSAVVSSGAANDGSRLQ